MAVEHTRIPFSDLVFLDDNPRTPEGLQQMAADIQADPTFFDNRPVLVNLSDGRHQVYAGDLRAHAAHDVLGWADIPCIVERDVPPDVMRRRAIIDNLHRETWAPDILATSWAADDLAGWGLTPDKWGGDADSADTPSAIGGYTASEDDYQPPAEIVTDIVPGDLFEIGPHRLLCGDSTSADDVAKVMGGEKPFLMVTDPPYGVEYDPNWRNEAAENGHLSYGARAIGKVSNDDRIDWTDSYSIAPCSVAYVWHADRHAKRVQENIEDSGFEIRCQIIWAKAHFAISRGHYNWQHEPCWYAVKKGATAKWIGDHSQSTLWQITHQKSETGHGTQKPVEAMARPIRNHEGDVYDPFLGSGTTMVAAHQLHRRCFGIEIDPKYCQVIIDRMLKLDPALTITRI